MASGGADAGPGGAAGGSPDGLAPPGAGTGPAGQPGAPPAAGAGRDESERWSLWWDVYFALVLVTTLAVVGMTSATLTRIVRTATPTE